MKSGKYDRQISLLCPTCGNTEFETDDGSAEATEMVKCASCGRELTRDELIAENSENISAHTKEIGKEVTKDIADEMRKSLKKAFRGSKNIRIK